MMTVALKRDSGNQASQGTFQIQHRLSCRRCLRRLRGGTILRRAGR